MTSPSWFFYHAGEAFDAPWVPALADTRAEVARTVKPMFTTVLDFSGDPESGDLNKTRYRGPLYFDFDLDDDGDGALEVVCNDFKAFLGKLKDLGDVDLSQIWMYASGGKGFHVEIPMECFIPNEASKGFFGLPLIYKFVARNFVVDSLDFKVYSARKGRMWRQPNIQRKNGKYKVQIFLDEALAITPESYLKLVEQPRKLQTPGTPVLSAKLSMLFNKAVGQVGELLKNKKRKADVTNKVLEVWKKSGKEPEPLAMLMDGYGIREKAGFQNIAMQLSIYATTMGWSKEKFLERCQGLAERHLGDSLRYNSPQRRLRELARMYDYMEGDQEYTFDAKPLAVLMERGIDWSGLGLAPEETVEEQTRREHLEVEAPEQAIAEAEQNSIRQGVIITDKGISVVKGGDQPPMTIMRATMKNVREFFDLDHATAQSDKSAVAGFRGFEVDLVEAGTKLAKMAVPIDTFASSAKLKGVLLNHKQAFQGSDAHTMSIMDIIARRAETVPAYVVPREGVMIIPHPRNETMVTAYVTKDVSRTSIPEGGEQISLQYRPGQAASSYNIDIHKAETLGPEHLEDLKLMFQINKPTVVADLVGWFLACHWKALFMEAGGQFPLLQVYGEAGSGKSQTAMTLSRLHWALREVSTKSAMSMTNFALDNLVSTTTSAPLVIDEYKPRELARVGRGKHEKLKDVFKQAYFGGEVGDRGTLNKGGDTQLAIISNKATAPICFLGEAIESETAIAERSITVVLSQSSHTPDRRKAFSYLSTHTKALSALGRFTAESAFSIDLEKMKEELYATKMEVEARVPADVRGRKRLPDRMIYNRAVILLTLRSMKKLTARIYGDALDADWDSLIHASDKDLTTGQSHISSVSEISKVISAIAQLSRKTDTPWEVRPGKEYIRAPGFTDFKVEECYDRYCAHARVTGQTVLFDSLDSFKAALRTFSAVSQFNVISSEIREDDSTETICRLDHAAMTAEQTQQFKSHS